MSYAAGLGASSVVSAIADAIDRMEGPAAKNNNPGNLRTWGNLPTSGGFAVFPTLEAGRAALESQVQRNINRGLTLDQFFCGGAGYGGYAPNGDGANDCSHYAANVSQWAGVPLGVPISASSGASGATDAGGWGFLPEIDLGGSWLDSGAADGLLGGVTAGEVLIGAGMALAAWLLVR